MVTHLANGLSLDNPAYLNGGETCWIRYGSKFLRCKVARAHGVHARVVNEDRGVNTLLSLADIWIEVKPAAER